MADKISPRQHEILKLLLQHKGGLTIDEIALAVSISRNAVAQHFVGLENKGYIRRCALNKTAGRPVYTYTLTEQGINYFPKQYAWFAELILLDLKQSLGAEEFVAYLQKLANNLAQQLLPQFAGKETAQKVELLMQIMTDLGFQVSLNPAGEAQQCRIEAANCVYHDLAQKHQEICEFDKTLLATLLAQPIEQVSCMAHGDHLCAFKMAAE